VTSGCFGELELTVHWLKETPGAGQLASKGRRTTDMGHGAPQSSDYAQARKDGQPLAVP
jgi:hypothetical protein